jgi:hypothetical protein
MKKISSFKKNKVMAGMIFLCFMTIVLETQAQNITQPALAATMESIYKNYDSIPFMSFDVKFNYTSDTLLGDYTNEQLEGTYTMAGKKAKYRLGDIDFMQNESFFIAVYNTDKIILVDVPKTNNSGNNLPLRQMMDSLVQSYTAQYNVNRNFTNTDTGIISFDRTDTTTQLEKFSITYDDRNKMILKIAYDYLEPVQLDSNVNFSSLPANRKKRLTIEFSNYRFDNYDDAVYNENNYIYFERGVCKPVAKYEDFKIYNSKPAVNIIQNP